MPALVYLLHVPASAAATASVVIVGVAAAVGVPAHARSGNVRWGAGAMFGIVGIVAAIAGTLLARQLPPAALLLAFAVIVALAAVVMIRDARRSARSATPAREVTGERATHPLPVGGPDPVVGAHPAAALTGDDEPEPAESSPPGDRGGRGARAAGVVGGGLGVGFMTGLFGVGGGFLAVPMLSLVMRWRLSVAIGTSLLVIVINSAASLASRLTVETLDWAVIVPVTAAAAVGVLLGKRVADRVSGPAPSGAFGVMLVLLALYTGVRSTLELLG